MRRAAAKALLSRRLPENNPGPVDCWLCFLPLAVHVPHACDPRIVAGVSGRSQSTRRSVAAQGVGRCLLTSLLR